MTSSDGQGRAGAGDPGEAIGSGDARAHLQAALLELIAAGRSALGAIEAVVAEPDSLDPLITTATSWGRVMADLARQVVFDAVARATAGPPTSSGSAAESDPSGPRESSGRPGLQRIRLS